MLPCPFPSHSGPSGTVARALARADNKSHIRSRRRRHAVQKPSTCIVKHAWVFDAVSWLVTSKNLCLSKSSYVADVCSCHRVFSAARRGELHYVCNCLDDTESKSFVPKVFDSHSIANDRGIHVQDISIMSARMMSLLTLEGRLASRSCRLCLERPELGTEDTDRDT